MANSLKKKVPPPPSPEVLTEDKEVDVTVVEVVKDERTTKIAGAISLLLTIFLFIAFTSYLFTWQEDQDKVYQFGIKIFATNDVRVHNLLGVLGAFVGHLFIYKGFGIASYLFCTFFFVLGINLLFGKKIFSLVRNLRYVMVGLVVISMALAFVASASDFSWGGAVGEMLSNWFVKWIGNVGTGALLVVTVFSYVIWRFNPAFKWPERKIIADTNDLNDKNDVIESNDNNYLEEDLFDEPDEQILPTSQNKLKEGATGKILVTPKEEAPTHDPLTAFGVTEKEIEASHVEEEKGKLFIAEEPKKKREKAIDTMVDLPLEIASAAHESVTVIMPKPSVDEMPFEVDDDNEAIEAKEPIIEARKPLKIEFDDEIDIELEMQDMVDDEDDEEVVDRRPSTVDHFGIDTLFDPTLELKDYKYPSIELLETHGSEKIVHDPNELETNKNQIIATLKNYDIAIQRIAATVGPTVTLYEIVPAPGVRISRIKNLEDDIALSLAALGIRIIAPIPGKGTIGIEVPNVRKTVVSMKTLLASEKFTNSAFSLPIAIGKKIDNENFIVDLATMPHLLMAGATGQGKSVGLNAILVSLLYKKHPSQLKFVLVDPKKVELSIYKVIEKHFLAKLPGEEESIITDTKKVVNTLNALCIEMDNRYDLLKEAGCRNIREYNEKFLNRKLNPQKGHQYLPFIVLVVDEFADLIMTAGKEVEMPIARLAQLARAIGIHLIIATQRPSVNIITGTIKANFPARIAFKVSSKIDSRTILDAGGAEQLIGKGDMLISYNGDITRLQCAFVDTPEVDKIVEFIGDQRGYPDAFLLPEYNDEKEEGGGKGFDAADRDPLFNDAAKLIVQNQVGSTSLIQRRMKLGYNRAGRLMDQLEAAGIVGANAGSKAREVLFKSEIELQEYLDSMG
ncbi:DNA translocase FtsK 4TM domain-containing protein [Parasediminibacterium paludis]|uniref:DNA translocase FtsK 4TM domain-containing protein n=1 Tax=Parasediminibacterium paludis TaxID=908966 RepID=A0ABV8PTB7_9BACT